MDLHRFRDRLLQFLRPLKEGEEAAADSQGRVIPLSDEPEQASLILIDVLESR